MVQMMPGEWFSILEMPNLELHCWYLIYQVNLIWAFEAGFKANKNESEITSMEYGSTKYLIGKSYFGVKK